MSLDFKGRVRAYPLLFFPYFVDIIDRMVFFCLLKTCKNTDKVAHFCGRTVVFWPEMGV